MRGRDQTTKNQAQLTEIFSLNECAVHGAGGVTGAKVAEGWWTRRLESLLFTLTCVNQRTGHTNRAESQRMRAKKKKK